MYVKYIIFPNIPPLWGSGGEWQNSEVPNPK